MNKWYEIYPSQNEWPAQMVDYVEHKIDEELYKFHEQNFDLKKELPKFEALFKFLSIYD